MLCSIITNQSHINDLRQAVRRQLFDSKKNITVMMAAVLLSLCVTMGTNCVVAVVIPVTLMTGSTTASEE